MLQRLHPSVLCRHILLLILPGPYFFCALLDGVSGVIYVCVIASSKNQNANKLKRGKSVGVVNVSHIMLWFRDEESTGEVSWISFSLFENKTDRDFYCHSILPSQDFPILERKPSVKFMSTTECRIISQAWNKTVTIYQSSPPEDTAINTQHNWKTNCVSRGGVEGVL